jgi:hypothetical protein
MVSVVQVWNIEEAVGHPIESSAIVITPCFSDTFTLTLDDGEREILRNVE